MSDLRYAVIIEPLSEADGGGFVAFAPDLPGCMSDGATPEEALANIIDAIAVWGVVPRRFNNGVNRVDAILPLPGDVGCDSSRAQARRSRPHGARRSRRRSLWKTTLESLRQAGIARGLRYGSTQE